MGGATSAAGIGFTSAAHDVRMRYPLFCKPVHSFVCDIAVQHADSSLEVIAHDVVGDAGHVLNIRPALQRRHPCQCRHLRAGLIRLIPRIQQHAHLLILEL